MFRIILFVLGAFILYKVIFDLIIPVFRTTRRIRRQFRDINQQMQEKMNQHNQAQASQPEPQPGKKTTDKDYIDFEEVK